MYSNKQSDQASLIRFMRRPGSDGMSLARRRAWFADEQDSETGASTGATDQASGAGTAGAESVEALPAWAQAIIKDARAEAAKYRTQAKEKERERQAQLETLGLHEQVAKERAAALAALEPKAARADALDEHVRKSVAARVAGLPEQMRTLVPQFDDPLKTLAWLDANEAILRRPTPPTMDAGSGGNGGGNAASLTDEERRIATLMNIDPAKMAKHKST